MAHYKQVADPSGDMKRAKKKLALEKGVRSRARRGALERAVLGALALGGMLTVALMAPKVLTLLKEEHLDYVLPGDPRQRLHEVMSRLKRKGLIEWKEQSGKRYPQLTARGQARVRQVELNTLSIPKPRRWDEKWRLVIFDIEHKKKVLRDKVRHTLKRLGFVRLQNSVWAHPYDCEEIVMLLKMELRSGNAVLYIIADAIEYDLPLRKHFGLSLPR